MFAHTYTFKHKQLYTNIQEDTHTKPTQFTCIYTHTYRLVPATSKILWSTHKLWGDLTCLCNPRDVVWNADEEPTSNSVGWLASSLSTWAKAAPDIFKDLYCFVLFYSLFCFSPSTRATWLLTLTKGHMVNIEQNVLASFPRTPLLIKVDFFFFFFF